MFLTELDLRSAPGLPDGLTLTDIGPGLVLVFGPNASGKSTIGRTLRGGLWPDQAPDGIDARTRWRTGPDGLTYCATTVFGRTEWDQEGVPLPKAEVADAARFTLRALLESADGSTSAIAQQVRLELDGGYDIDGLQLVATPRVRPLPKVRKPLQTAESALKEAERKSDALAHDEGRLAALETQVAEAANAPERLALVRSALEAAAARRRADEVETLLAGMTDVHPNLTQETADRFKEQEKRVEAARARRSEVEKLLTEAQDAANREAFPDQRPLSAVLETYVKRARALKQLREHAAKGRTTRDEARARRDACRALVWSTPEAPRELSAGDLQKLEESATALAIAEQRLDALEAPPEPTAPPLDATALGVLDDGRVLLRRWLKEPRNATRPDADTSSRGHLLLPGVGVVLLLLVAVALAVTGRYILMGLLLLGLGGLCAGLLRRRSDVDTTATEPSESERLKEQYAGLGLPPVEAWTVSGVSAALEALEARKAGDKKNQDAEKDAKRHVQRVERLEAAGAEARRGLSDLVEALGLSPEFAGVALVHQAQRLAEWAAAEVELAAAEARLVTETREGDAEASALARALTSLKLPELPDLQDETHLLPAAEETLERLKRLAHAEEKLDERTKEATVAREQADTEAQEFERLTTRLGLAGVDSTELPALLARAEEWREARDEKEASLKDHTRLSRGLPEDLPEDLGGEQSRLEKLCEEHKKLTDEVAEIRARIRAATEAGTISDALSKQSAGMQLLAEDREQQLVAHLGRALKDWMQQERRVHDTPHLLARAREWFLTFTHQRYEIDIHGRQGFVAKDLHTGALQELEQLSDGTRVQLLLACRLAYLEDKEGHTPTPLFLDEVLSTADPERFAAVAGAVLELCRRGRQVFYATSNPAEVRAWQEAAASLGFDAPQLHNLGDAAPAADWTDAPGAPKARRALPPTAGHDAVSWCDAAELPRPGLWDDADRWPLALVLHDDLGAAHAAAVVGATRVAHLKRLAEDASAILPLDASRIERARARVRAIEAVLGALRVGRSRPVTWEHVQASRAVTAKFTERVQAKMHGHAHDASVFLQAVDDINGFRTKAHTALAEYLQGAGLLDPRDRWTAEQVVAAAQEATRDDQAAGRLDLREVEALADWCARVVGVAT